MFREVVKKLVFVARSINIDVLFSNQARHPYNGNSMVALENSGQVKRIASGMFLYQGDYLRVFKSLNNYVLGIAFKHGAIEQEYPILWPLEIFRKTNYFKDFPQHTMLVSTVKNNFESKSEFANLYDNKNEYESVDLSHVFDNARLGLQPAVCDTCYYALSNKTNYTNKVYTTYNKVFRNETSKTGALDRLTNFSVRDVMFVGEKQFVLETRQKLIDDLIEMLMKLNLKNGKKWI